MMKILMVSCVLVLVLALRVNAAPMDWQGSFGDSIYGGETRVCVDQSTSTAKYYAQALFSDLGKVL